MGESKECKEIILDDGEVYIRITPLNWLNAESDDDIVVEHSEGQTINISHANVVIFD